MATSERYQNSRLRERWDTTSGYTAWDAQGAQTAQRALTAAESAALAAQDAQQTIDQNGVTLRSRAQAALTANTTYLALASPTTAQNTAQLKTVTKECNALIRLALNLLDDISGT